MADQLTVATPADLKMRYPAFDAVDDARVQYWLTDADRYVNDSWGADADPGRIDYAAHQLVVTKAPGIADDSDLTAMGVPAGVTKFRSASMDVQITEAGANRSLSSGWDASIYGQAFAVLLRRHNGGPRLVGYVEPRCDVYGYSW